MLLKPVTYTFYSLLIALVMILGMISLNLSVFFPRDPIPNGYTSVEVLNPVIKRGEKTKVRIYRDKPSYAESCLVISLRFAENVMETYQLPTYAGPSGSSDLNYIDITYDTRRLNIGLYDLYSVVMYLCNGSSYYHITPKGKVEIVV